MAYNSLQEFVQVLEREGELKRVTYPIKAELEITEIADLVMKSGLSAGQAGGPALLFENVVGKKIPVLINAFGSPKRIGVNPIGWTVTGLELEYPWVGCSFMRVSLADFWERGYRGEFSVSTLFPSCQTFL